MGPLFRTTAPEPWATAWGEDRFGFFQAFEVKGVEQRLRWAPPGRFSMGSPRGEAGRWMNEGPRHEVAHTRGFWLADTPCTQGLYLAVMGANPSRFQDPRRPVERVSWNDANDFLLALGKQVAGLAPRLPSEAEWEYACRAGTAGPVYETAPWQILGQNDAPALDRIAWYGGNAGERYELTDFVDSGKWPEKARQHSRAGTRRVALKQPNPWGLFDTLGNVFEWCADGMRPYTSTSEPNPMGPTDPGTLRVLRGGSWLSDARAVRAATRFSNQPHYKHEHLGFRIARSEGH